MRRRLARTRLPARARALPRPSAARAPLLLGVCAAVALAVASAATATAAPPDPSRNLPLGPLPNACAGAPTGSICEAASIARLDAGRARLGLGPYRLPADFITLRPVRQWLILANLDRIAYSLPPIVGVSSALDTVALAGARSREDPNPWPLLASLQGQQRLGFASNWAGGAPNAVVAYFSWMYDDGYGSGNIDCTSPSASGCWGHRHTILAFPGGHTLSLGGGVVRSEASYALTVVETSTRVWPYTYTWAQAKADGAGRG